MWGMRQDVYHVVRRASDNSLVRSDDEPKNVVRTELKVWSSSTTNGMEDRRVQTGITITYYVED